MIGKELLMDFTNPAESRPAVDYPLVSDGVDCPPTSHRHSNGEYFDGPDAPEFKAADEKPEDVSRIERMDDVVSLVDDSYDTWKQLATQAAVTNDSMDWARLIDATNQMIEVFKIVGPMLLLGRHILEKSYLMKKMSSNLPKEPDASAPHPHRTT